MLRVELLAVATLLRLQLSTPSERRSAAITGDLDSLLIRALGGERCAASLYRLFRRDPALREMAAIALRLERRHRRELLFLSALGTFTRQLRDPWATRDRSTASHAIASLGQISRAGTLDEARSHLKELRRSTPTRASRALFSDCWRIARTARLASTAGSDLTIERGLHVSPDVSSDATPAAVISTSFLRSASPVSLQDISNAAAALAALIAEVGGLPQPTWIRVAPPPPAEETMYTTDEGRCDCAPRYVDITLFAESSPGSRARGAHWPAALPLEVAQRRWYLLEVTVRAQRLGIPTSDTNDRPMREPLVSHLAELTITAESTDFDIEEEVRTLLLPPKGEAYHPATFRVRPRGPTGSADLRAALTIRVYYHFNLLEAVILEAETVRAADCTGRSRFGLPSALTVRHGRIESQSLNLHDILPRAIHIDVTRRAPGAYHCAVLFRSASGGALPMNATIRLSDDALSEGLIRIRRLLAGLGAAFAHRDLTGSDVPGWSTRLRALATEGHALWQSLFATIDRESAAAHVARWLQEHPPTDDAVIQISVDKDATSFVFPWAVLYDRPLPIDPDEPVDLSGFWGARFIIEQRLPIDLPCRDIPSPLNESGLEIGLLLWNFAETEEQKAFVTQFATALGARIATGDAVTSPREARAYLTRCESDLLYYFAHGHAAAAVGDAGGFRIEHFLELYDELPPLSPLREHWRAQYADLQEGRFEVDRSWIALALGKLYLDELIDDSISLSRHPIVILNMCESAQVLPSLNRNFVWLFMAGGACAVVGTECSIPTRLGHVIGRTLLQHLGRGATLGQALRRVRCELLDAGNPLGLAYTIFGSAVTSLPVRIAASS